MEPKQKKLLMILGGVVAVAAVAGVAILGGNGSLFKGDLGGLSTVCDTNTTTNCVTLEATLTGIPTTAKFAFTPTYSDPSKLDKNSSMFIEFPKEFYVGGVTGATCTNLDGGLKFSPPGDILPQTVRIDRMGNGSEGIGAAIQCEVYGVMPREVTSKTGNFIIKFGNTGNSYTYATDPNFVFLPGVRIDGGPTKPPVKGTVTLDNYTAGEKSIATVKFTTTKVFPLMGQIKINFHNGFNFNSTTGKCSSSDARLFGQSVQPNNMGEILITRISGVDEDTDLLVGEVIT